MTPSRALSGTAFAVILVGLALALDVFGAASGLGTAGQWPRNSAIMNVEPVFALVLAWLVLDQSIAPIQVAGAPIVVGTVMPLGTRRQARRPQAHGAPART